MSHTTEPQRSTPGQQNTDGQRPEANTSAACSESAGSAHTSADKSQVAARTSWLLCVYSKQITPTYTHAVREGCGSQEPGLFIDVLPLREVDRARECKQKSKWEEGLRESKVKEEEWADWTSKAPDSLPPQLRLHGQQERRGWMIFHLSSLHR